MSNFYYKELLQGLDTVPTPNSPGTIIVTGSSQAILTTNAGDVIIAAAEYGDGKIITFAHDSYLHWLFESKKWPELTTNVISWLTWQNTLQQKEMIDMDEIDFDRIRSLSKYKLLKWNALYKMKGDFEEKLLKYLKMGGSLLCASCPWGWLQLNPGKTLSDMELNRFLANFDMTFTSKCLELPDEINVADNQAKYGNFGHALEKIFTSSCCIRSKERYLNTLSCGFSIFEKNADLINQIVTPDRLDFIQRICESNRELTPSEKKPVRDQACKAQLNIYCKLLNNKECIKAPGIQEFPGDFKEQPVLLKNVRIKIEAKFAEWHSTGYYLPASVSCKIKLIGDCEYLNLAWSVRIGAHTDDLKDCDSITRWPCISKEYPVYPEMEVSSPYGGLIYFESFEEDAKIEAILSNVVESPYFDLTKPNTLNEWSSRRNAPGLWAELAGKHIVFTAPSSCIRGLRNPKALLEFWDQVVQLHHKLRGTLPSDQRRERVVNDQQPSIGYMHSGYPIVTGLDVCQREHEFCLFDLEKLVAKGNWGLFHELGHNMQRDEWTFDGSAEVTVNFFTLHAYHLLIGKDINQVYWLRDQKNAIKEFLTKRRPATYDDWKSDYGVGLYTFGLLFKHFGWQSIRKFLSEYESDLNANRRLPSNNQEKLDQWVLRYSKIVGYNIGPHFERFGLPVSRGIHRKLAHMNPLMIDIQPEEFFKLI